MSVTVVHDYYFKPDGDVAEGKAAAAAFVDYLKTLPAVQLTLWLEDRENSLHHFHINVFDAIEDLEQVAQTEEVQAFTARLYPQTARRTHLAPLRDVWLAEGRGVQQVRYP